MKLLVAQPFQEEGLTQLKKVVINNQAELIVFPEDYLTGKQQLTKAKELARKHKVIICTGILVAEERRGIIIDQEGKVILDRPKAPKSESLADPGYVSTSEGKIGLLLCRELYHDFSPLAGCDLIVNPIGVGMYSNRQFRDWISRARYIAECLNVYLLGSSHADGSFYPGGRSIPIAYCFDEQGEKVFVKQNEVGSVKVEIEGGVKNEN